MATTINGVFRKVTAALRKQGQAAADAMTNQKPFAAELYGSEGTVKATDRASIRQFFDRTGLAQQYVATLERPGPQNGINVAIAAKLQSDFLAQCERDFVMQRAATRAGERCHYAARRLAHGDDDGPVAKGIAYAPYAYLILDPNAGSSGSGSGSGGSGT